MGKKRAALDSERNIESAFYLSEWRLRGQWHIPKKEVTFQLRAGISLNSRMHYRDLVAGWQEKDLEPSAFIALGASF